LFYVVENLTSFLFVLQSDLRSYSPNWTANLTYRKIDRSGEGLKVETHPHLLHFIVTASFVLGL